MIQVKLTLEQRKELAALRRGTDDPRKERALAVLRSAEGLSPPAIAAQLGRHPHTVRDWLKRFGENGVEGLSRVYSPGRPSERAQDLAPRLRGWLEQSPSEHGWLAGQWTVRLIQAQYLKEAGRRLSEDTVARALHDTGFSYKRPKKVVPVAAPSKEEKLAAVNETIDELRDLVQRGEVEVFALDESHFSTEPYVVRGWHPRGSFFPSTFGDQAEGRHLVWRVEHADATFLLEKRPRG
jgi:transposase